MNIDQWVKDVVPFMVTFVAMVAWFIRLEAKGLANEKAINDGQKQTDKLDNQLRAFDSKIVDKLSYIERSLAKIEGSLGVTFHKDN